LDYRTVKPFIKWAGGKSQLINEIRKKYPKNINRYCEPFVGGGAVLLDILNNNKPKDVIINDINKDLINTYSQVQNNVYELIQKLTELQTFFLSKEYIERKTLYLKMRERYNQLKSNNNDDNNIELATLFIFLNKTCFNGL